MKGLCAWDSFFRKRTKANGRIRQLFPHNADIVTLRLENKEKPKRTYRFALIMSIPLIKIFFENDSFRQVFSRSHVRGCACACPGITAKIEPTNKEQRCKPTL